MLLRAEKLLVAAACTVFVLYRFFGLPLRQPIELYLTRVVGAFAWYALGLFLTVFFLRLSDLNSRAKPSRLETWQRFKASYLRTSQVCFDLRLVHATGFLFVIFIQLKHLTPFIHPRLFDEAFLAQERVLFSGKLASEHLIAILGMDIAGILSDAYVGFFPYMGLLLATMLLQRDRLLAEQFAFGFCALWLLGIIFIYLLPTLGPCFFRPELFSALPQTDVSTLQSELWQEKLFVEKEPFSLKGVFLISGFPSLHIAILVFGSLVLQSVRPILSVLSWVFTFVTFLTTLYFGWHYVLDDIGGFLLGGAVFRIVVTSVREKRLMSIH